MYVYDPAVQLMGMGKRPLAIHYPTITLTRLLGFKAIDDKLVWRGYGIRASNRYQNHQYGAM